MPPRQPWLGRFRAELGNDTGPHDPIVRLIILEKIVKTVLLIVIAIGLVALGRTGVLYRWAVEAHRELLLGSDTNLPVVLLDRLLVYIGDFPHLTALGLVLVLYAVLEGSEGVGLAMHKRWAEYLTVFATGLLIPYEVYEVALHPTLFKTGALLLNVAVVGYLAYKKRLFVGV